MSTPIRDLADFTALQPFFDIVQKGLSGLVDGEHYFDLLTEDAVIDFVVTVPGYPSQIIGREALAELYRSYGDGMRLHSADELSVYHDREKNVVVLEYAVHGRVVATDDAYTNHFVSILTIRNRKIVHWRDYLDPVAVFDAYGWPTTR